MKTIIYYNVAHSYNAGYLGADYYCKTLDEAEKFIEDYKSDKTESNKAYTLKKIIKVKFLGITIKTKIVVLYAESLND